MHEDRQIIKPNGKVKDSFPIMKTGADCIGKKKSEKENCTTEKENINFTM